MIGIPKIRKVLDEAHLNYVRRQTCMDCCRSLASLDPVETMKRARMSDPHHLPNTTHPRRFFDWLTVPLCRQHHGRMDTQAGKIAEKMGRRRYIEKAALLLLHNGRITIARYDALLKGQDVEEWIDSLVQEAQNWDGRTPI